VSQNELQQKLKSLSNLVTIAEALGLIVRQTGWKTRENRNRSGYLVSFRAIQAPALHGTSGRPSGNVRGGKLGIFILAGYRPGRWHLAGTTIRLSVRAKTRQGDRTDLICLLPDRDHEANDSQWGPMLRFKFGTPRLRRTACPELFI
jgi:hypothetical protein